MGIRSVSNRGWLRSSRCESSHCVEVLALPGQALMRDAKDADGPVLSFGAEGWLRFLGGIRAGRYGRGDW